MLFFRSEERLREWCAGRKVAPGPAVSMMQLWGLATQWFSTRFSPDAQRPTPAEVRRIFASVGLPEAFWDPEA